MFIKITWTSGQCSILESLYHTNKSNASYNDELLESLFFTLDLMYEI